jgi:hypothetical protein
MVGFFQYFFNIDDMGTEHAVCCPFPHHTTSGAEYFEAHPSASVNLKEKLFHCKVCGTGYSEVQFIKAIYECTYTNATRLSQAFNNTETLDDWNEETLPEYAVELCHSYGITDAVIEELRIKSRLQGTIAFPVLIKMYSEYS